CRPYCPRLSFLPLPTRFFTDPPPAEIYTLSLHDALPILAAKSYKGSRVSTGVSVRRPLSPSGISVTGCPSLSGWCGCDRDPRRRSEEHTSELQSRENLVCRLLLEKKKKNKKKTTQGEHDA